MVRIHPCPFSHAEVAQLVEQHLDMVEVVGSSPIPRIENNTFAPRIKPPGAFSFKEFGLRGLAYDGIVSVYDFSVQNAGPKCTRLCVFVYLKRVPMYAGPGKTKTPRG